MHCLSIDLEDWFHFLDMKETRDVAGWHKYEKRVEQMTLPLLDFLDDHNQSATFFVLGWIAENHPDLVREVVNRGHEIACHSYSHPLVYEMTAAAFEKDLCLALDTIEAVTGIRATAFRAPGFSITRSCLWAFEILRKHGIEMDSSIFPAHRAHGGLPGAPISPFVLETQFGEIHELPISSTTLLGRRYVYSGGGYFRIFPGWSLKRLFMSSEKNNNPTMTYFHPRDFYANEPTLDLTFVRHFKATVNLAQTFQKLSCLLSLYEFGTVTEYDRFQNWMAAPRVTVDALAGNA